MGLKAGFQVNERAHILDEPEHTQASIDEYVARRPRHLWSLSTIGGILLNVLITICPIYFIVYGILIYKQDLTPLESVRNQQLLEASIYGPTIFPVVFAAIVGKTLKAIADWKLECGTRIATLEYLLASRTVSGALIAPLRFRVVHLLVLPLILLWSLSPLGSQASLRVISSTTLYNSTDQVVTHLDVNGSQPLIAGASDLNHWINAVTSTFNAAVFSANNAKDAPQDPYGNVKIPLLEALPPASNNNSWSIIPPQGYNSSMYSSMVGLPCSGVPSSGKANYTVETSYFSVNCTIGGVPASNLNLISKWQSLDPYSSGVAWNGDQMGIGFDLYHYNSTSGLPRNLTLWSLDSGNETLSTAMCQLTTTFVEVQVQCSSGRCNASAIRPSALQHADKNWSGIDLMGKGSLNFFNSFVNTSSKVHMGTSSPIEFYLNDPRSAIRPLDEVLLATVDQVLFSQRFAQLLNSFWMITLTPTGALGQDFTQDMKTQSTAARSVVGASQTSQLVLLCNKPWLVVLLLSAMAMIMAGILTTVLDACRKGPDVLDLVVSLIRENPHAQVVHQSSLECGSDQVRRLCKVDIRFGDIQPEAAFGHAAIATPSDEAPVQLLQRTRLYT